MDLKIEEASFEDLKSELPNFLTPGAAEALAIKVYRLVKVESLSSAEALKACLADYQNPVAPEILGF